MLLEIVNVCLHKCVCHCRKPYQSSQTCVCVLANTQMRFITQIMGLTFELLTSYKNTSNKTLCARIEELQNVIFAACNL